jgi:hypothetical protein
MALTRFSRIGLPLVAAIAVSAAVAAPAIAVPGLASRIGTYKTWAQAQKAAGYQLMKPTATYSLPNEGHIIVSVCEVQGETSKRAVLHRGEGRAVADLEEQVRVLRRVVIRHVALEAGALREHAQEGLTAGSRAGREARSGPAACAPAPQRRHRRSALPMI